MYIIFAIVFFRIEKLTIARYIEQNYVCLNERKENAVALFQLRDKTTTAIYRCI